MPRIIKPRCCVCCSQMDLEERPSGWQTRMPTPTLKLWCEKMKGKVTRLCFSSLCCRRGRDELRRCEWWICTREILCKTKHESQLRIKWWRWPIFTLTTLSDSPLPLNNVHGPWILLHLCNGDLFLKTCSLDQWFTVFFMSSIQLMSWWVQVLFHWRHLTCQVNQFCE